MRYGDGSQPASETGGGVPSVYDMLSNVRVHLNHPRAQQPSEDDVLVKVLQHLRHFLNTLNNTNLTWDYRTLTLTVDPEVATYAIPDVSFGKAFAVLTRDDANPSHVVRKVDFFEAPNLNFNWDWPGNIGSWLNNWDGSLHTARRVAFYWADGIPYVSFLPTPQLSCDYDISFSVGDASRNLSLDSIPILSQYHDLVELRAARSLLPSSIWHDDEEKNVSKRRELALSLTADEQMYNEQFLFAARTKDAGSGITRRAVTW